MKNPASRAEPKAAVGVFKQRNQHVAFKTWRALRILMIKILEFPIRKARQTAAADPHVAGSVLHQRLDVVVLRAAGMKINRDELTLEPV